MESGPYGCGQSDKLVFVRHTRARSSAWIERLPPDSTISAKILCLQSSQFGGWVLNWHVRFTFHELLHEDFRKR